MNIPLAKVIVPIRHIVDGVRNQIDQEDAVGLQPSKPWALVVRALLQATEAVQRLADATVEIVVAEVVGVEEVPRPSAAVVGRRALANQEQAHILGLIVDAQFGLPSVLDLVHHSGSPSRHSWSGGRPTLSESARSRKREGSKTGAAPWSTSSRSQRPS